MKKFSAKPLVIVHEPKGRRPQLVYYEGGRQVRRSAKSNDPAKVEDERRELEFRLQSGNPIRAAPKRGAIRWKDFLAEYTASHIRTLRKKAADTAKSRLDVCEKVAKPLNLSDMADRQRIDQLVSDLRAGLGRPDRNGKPDIRPRSAYTVRGLVSQLLAALRWAHRRGWLAAVPSVEPIRVARLRSMRGRAITQEEFERLLDAVPKVIARKTRGVNPLPEVDQREQERIESYRFLLWGLWTSGLRLGELMSVSWDDPNEIVPELGRLPTLAIPAARQKNDTEESIPCLPEFATLLRTIPKERRSGWVFRPKVHKPVTDRLLADYVGKVVGRIGKESGVVVLKSPLKYASAHDLRRSVAQRMIDAGVSMFTVQCVMRHADFKTTQKHYGSKSVERAASELAEAFKDDEKPTTHTVCEVST